MRIPYKPDTRKNGDTRTRTFFAWMPTRMPDKSVVWLERVTVRETLQAWHCALTGDFRRWEWQIVEELRPPATPPTPADDSP